MSAPLNVRSHQTLPLDARIGRRRSKGHGAKPPDTDDRRKLRPPGLRIRCRTRRWLCLYCRALAAEVVDIRRSHPRTIRRIAVGKPTRKPEDGCTVLGLLTSLTHRAPHAPIKQSKSLRSQHSVHVPTRAARRYARRRQNRRARRSVRRRPRQSVFSGTANIEPPGEFGHRFIAASTPLHKNPA
jgi:hypothetical protein